MVGFIDIKTLTFDELVGIVNLYPWFGGARKELCLRMAAMGDGALSEDEMAAAAMYLPSRRILADVVRRTVAGEFKDADVENIIKSYVVQKETSGQSSKRRVYAGAGDYFSQEEYDRARQEGDNVFSRASLRAGKEPVEYVAAASTAAVTAIIATPALLISVLSVYGISLPSIILVNSSIHTA